MTAIQQVQPAQAKPKPPRQPHTPNAAEGLGGWLLQPGVCCCCNAMRAAGPGSRVLMLRSFPQAHPAQHHEPQSPAMAQAQQSAAAAAAAASCTGTGGALLLVFVRAWRQSSGAWGDAGSIICRTCLPLLLLACPAAQTVYGQSPVPGAATA